MVKITVRVNRAHLRDGTRGCLWSCPLALALHAMLCDPTTIVRVEAYQATLTPPDGVHQRISLTPPVQKFIERFDAGAHVSPRSFRLHIPDDARSLFTEEPS